MSRRAAFVLSGTVLGMVVLAAVVSNAESRDDFLIRLQVGDLDVDAPELNPPDVRGPEVEPPRVDGPEVGAPSLDLLDVLITIGLIAAAVIAVFAVVLVVRRYGPGPATRVDRRRTTDIAATHGDDRPSTVGDRGWAAFERFVHDLLRHPDPARAIRVAMQYAEGGFGRLEARLADETPFEWLGRAASRQEDLAPSLTALVGAYNLVRFGGQPATPDDRDRAVAALRTLARNACSRQPPDPSTAPAMVTSR